MTTSVEEEGIPLRQRRFVEWRKIGRLCALVRVGAYLRTMKADLAHAAAVLLVAAAALGGPSLASAACSDPLPIDPAVVTKALGLKAFNGASQTGPVCHVRWDANSGSGPSLLVYGPTWLERMGQKFSSPKQAAERYSGESPKGVEALPGVANGYMVYDPKTPNRRVFVEYDKKVYMIVSGDSVPLATLAKAVIRK